MSWQTPLALCLWATFVVLCLAIVAAIVRLWGLLMDHADELGASDGRAIREGMSG